MGWCSGTTIFDMVVKMILESKDDVEKKKANIKTVKDELEGQDWDCQEESEYWHDPLVREVFGEDRE